MRYISRTFSQLLHFGSIVLVCIVITGCSNLKVKQFTLPANAQFEVSKSIEGVSVFVQPILEDKDNNSYFGDEMLEHGILPVFFAIKNNGKIGHIFLYDATIDGENINSTASAADTLNVVANSLRYAGDFGWHLSMLAMEIEENAEYQRLRPNPIEPGQQLSGYLYLDYSKLKNKENLNLCYRLLNPLTDTILHDCVNTALSGVKQ